MISRFRLTGDNILIFVILVLAVELLILKWVLPYGLDTTTEEMMRR